ncbi:MAG TPA: aminotransferase class V-fold PLP-dependent enzyme [Acidobacteriaceae bacterium]
MTSALARAVSALGEGPLTEACITAHIAPLFSRVLASDEVYLANHSLGRPMDAMATDIAEGAALWYERLGDAWEPWLEEQQAFRGRIADLIHAPRVDCVVPKTSAGQGLRTIVNALHGKLRVVSTRGEFDSVDVILKQYAALGRIEVRWVEASAHGEFQLDDVLAAIDSSVDLVVISQVMFMTGQIIHSLDRLAKACHRQGARLLVDAYHAIGVFPVDVTAMKTDFLIGGSYKYLRGGPGASFLYLSEEALNSGLRPLDTGWFANAGPFSYERPDPPALRAGGDAFLEGTPPILTWYQARSGQEFVLALGVERLRRWSLDQMGRLKGYLAEAGVHSVTGGDGDHGAFLTVRHPEAIRLPVWLAEHRIVADARGEWLRLCPDCLTRDEELRRAAVALGSVLAAI